MSKKIYFIVAFVILALVLVSSCTSSKQDEESEAGMSVDGDASDWQHVQPVLTDPPRDTKSKSIDEDLKALYVTSDNEYLYFMVEFYGQEPRSSFDIHMDFDLDGIKDHTIHTKPPDHPDGPIATLDPQAGITENVSRSRSVAVFGQVVELKFPLKDINVEKFRIVEIAINSWTAEQGGTYAGGWQGFSEIDIK